MRKLAAVLLFLISVPLAAQTIRGRVTTEGSPLPGVTVSIDSLGLSTLTDAQGNYALKVPASHKGAVKVSASFQGFQTRSATVDVSTDATPSRESHELRHCENARQARSGLPRWPTDDSNPAIAPTNSTSSTSHRAGAEAPSTHI